MRGRREISIVDVRAVVQKDMYNRDYRLRRPDDRIRIVEHGAGNFPGLAETEGEISLSNELHDGNPLDFHGSCEEFCGRRYLGLCSGFHWRSCGVVLEVVEYLVIWSSAGLYAH